MASNSAANPLSSAFGESAKRLGCGHGFERISGNDFPVPRRPIFEGDPQTGLHRNQLRNRRQGRQVELHVIDSKYAREDSNL